VGSGFRPLLQRVRVFSLLAALLLSACTVKVDVRVNSTANGSGTVTVTAALDKEAAQQAGNLEVSDLEQAGWTVTAVDGHDGGRVYTATHGFGSPAELEAVLKQVGPFTGVSLRTGNSLLKTNTRFTGDLDLTPGLAVFSDNDLRKKLGSAGIGLDPAAVKDATGVDIDKVLSMDVTVAIPGRTVTEPAIVGQKLRLDAHASHYNTTRIEFLVVAAVAALAGLVLLFRRRSA
jgi:hypothetical protein